MHINDLKIAMVTVAGKSNCDSRVVKAMREVFTEAMKLELNRKIENLKHIANCQIDHTLQDFQSEVNALPMPSISAPADEPIKTKSFTKSY